jgi:hypothetical protein
MSLAPTPNKLIPNELKITINTSIPGYQQLFYSPSMTIPSITDSEVFFNPLVYLDKSLIDKIPKNIREKQFLNFGLFFSLLNYLKTTGTSFNTLLKLKDTKEQTNLLSATQKGFVDNNITVTIDTLFKENNILYINKKPYIIVKSQWNKGDWKIDTKKQKIPIDLNKISNPFLKAAIIDESINTGKEQIEELKELVPDAIVGSGYTLPPLTPSKPTIHHPPTPSSTPLSSTPSTSPTTLLLPALPPIPPTSTGLVPYTKPTVALNSDDFDFSLFIFINISLFYTNIINNKARFEDITIFTFKQYNSFLNTFKDRKKHDEQFKTLKAIEKMLQKEIDAPVDTRLNKTSMRKIIALGNKLLKYIEADKSLIGNTITTEKYREYEHYLNTQIVPFIFVKSEGTHLPSAPPLPSIPLKKGPPTEHPMKTQIRGGSQNITKSMRSYLYNNRYFSLLNQIYTVLSPDEKGYINDVMKKMTTTDIKKDNKGLSKAAYMDPECIKFNTMLYEDEDDKHNLYFRAIAYALNAHNFTNNTKLITLELETAEGPRKFSSYDHLDLRNHVYYSFVKSDKIRTLRRYIDEILDNFNDAYNKGIENILRDNSYEDITEEAYTNIIHGILYGYELRGSNLFIVYSGSKVEKNPFRYIPLEDKNIHDYFFDTYRGDEQFCNECLIDTGLNCITITLFNNGSNPSRSDFRGQYTVDIDKSSFIMKAKNEEDPNFSIFLYKDISTDLNYSLLQFDYLLKKGRLVKGKSFTQYVFIQNPDTNILPPIGLLFLIYSQMYDNPDYGLTEIDELQTFKSDFTFYPAMMRLFDKGVDKIRRTALYPIFKKDYEYFFEYMQRNLHRDKTFRGGGDKKKPSYLSKIQNLENIPQIAYYITIDMELYPGDDPKKLPYSIKRNLKCKGQWNSIRKSYSQIMGTPYVKPPDYSLYKTEDDTKNNDTRKKHTDKRKKHNETRRNYETRRYNETRRNYDTRRNYETRRRR